MMNKKALLVSIMCIGSLIASDDGIEVFLGEVQERNITSRINDDSVNDNTKKKQINCYSQECTVNDACEIAKLKRILGLPENCKRSLLELRRSKAQVALTAIRVLFEYRMSREDIDKVNKVLRQYKDVCIEDVHNNDTTLISNVGFLYIFMRMLLEHSNTLDSDTIDALYECIQQNINNIEKSTDNKKRGLFIYKWLQENAEYMVEEYEIDL